MTSCGPALRIPTAHTDGSPIYSNAADAAHEREVAALCERAWDCELRHFGKLAAVDWYALRHGRVIGVAELKARTHEIGRHPSVWLNVRKWLALQLTAIGLGVPALFVVRFTDGVQWIDVRQINTAGRLAMRGTRGTDDAEPVIEVGVEDMIPLGVSA